MDVVAACVQAEDTTSLQALVDDGADLTAVNGVGQTLYEVAQEKGKKLSLQWLDQMNAAVRPRNTCCCCASCPGSGSGLF